LIDHLFEFAQTRPLSILITDAAPILKSGS